MLTLVTDARSAAELPSFVKAAGGGQVLAVATSEEAAAALSSSSSSALSLPSVATFTLPPPLAALPLPAAKWRVVGALLKAGCSVMFADVRTASRLGPTFLVPS